MDSMSQRRPSMDQFTQASRDRISTMRKTTDYGNEEEAGEAWVFPIGWNRNVDPETGLASNEPRDPRFLSNEI